MGMQHLLLCAIGVATPFLLIGKASAAVETHRVTTLPGYPGDLPGAHFSGYLNVSLPEQDRIANVHYWFVENAKADPKAPTVLWLQGGPGGSSLIAMFTENGPFTLNDASMKDLDSNGVPRVYDNPHGWHMAANMLYVEHPAPTGFSYCVDKNDKDSGCEWSDESQAVLSYQFLVKFFALYPEYATQSFYLSGESYAGVLVPTLAMNILAARADNNKGTAPWNVEGIMLGNAVPGSRILTATPYSGWLGARVAVDFRYGHGMISEKSYLKVLEVCEGYWGTFDPPSNKECRDLLEGPIRPMISETGDTDLMGGGYYIYDTCDPDLLYVQDGIMNIRQNFLESLYLPLQTASAKVDRRRLGSQDDGRATTGGQPREVNAEFPNNAGTYACGQERVSQLWLNMPSVQAALHVKPQPFQFSTQLKYDFTIASLVDKYKTHLLPFLRVMQYSGSEDPCVPYVGTQRWIEGLNLHESRSWQPWRVDNQVAGYSKVFTQEHPSGKGAQSHTMTFATVRNAGHMVPRYKPKQALHLLRAFLANKAP